MHSHLYNTHILMSCMQGHRCAKRFQNHLQCHPERGTETMSETNRVPKLQEVVLIAVGSTSLITYIQNILHSGVLKSCSYPSNPNLSMH